MISEKLKAWPFYLLPHHAISWLMFKLARIEWPPMKNFAIRVYTSLNPVHMEEAVIEDRFAYPTLNAFFTRELKPECRPFAEEPDLLCPVDGSVSQAGRIDGNEIFQAKGHRYTISELLGGDDISDTFVDGRFATLYLSPRDYHRIHMPVTGSCTKMRYIPGRLFSVAEHTVNQIPRLFARNERCVCMFDTEAGKVAMVLVGAINVSAIETVWHGLVQADTVTDFDYPDEPVNLERGDEMGRFNLGSTVILLMQEGFEWDGSITAGAPIKLGQAIGRTV